MADAEHLITAARERARTDSPSHQLLRDMADAPEAERARAENFRTGVQVFGKGIQDLGIALHAAESERDALIAEREADRNGADCG